MIPCMMPIEEGHLVNHQVLCGIAMQSVDVGLMLSPMLALEGAQRECSINFNRYKLRGMLSKEYQGYVLLMDSDVVLDDPCTVDKMLEAMAEDPTIGCIAVQTKPELDSHVVTACALLSAENYRKIDYISSPAICQCRLIAMNLNVRYLDGVMASELP